MALVATHQTIVEAIVTLNFMEGRKARFLSVWGVPSLTFTVLLVASAVDPVRSLFAFAPLSLLLALSAGLCCWVWWRVAFGPPPPLRLARRPLRAMVIGAFAGAFWSLAWVLLPAWGLLKLVCLLAFAPVTVLRWRRAGRPVIAAGVWVGWVLALVLVLQATFARPWPRERLLTSLGFSGVDPLGWHYQWSRLMDALAALSPTGGSGSAVPPVLTQVDDAAWLLRVGAAFGWVPMGLVASGLVLLWLLLAAYMSRSPVGACLSLRSRRMGLALALLHALAAALYGAWSLGYLYRPMGALAPMAHSGWWVLSAVLTVMVGRAWRQRRLTATVAAVGAPTTDVPAWRSGWKSGWAVVCSVWLLLSAAAVASFPGHVRERQEARSSQGNRHGLADKLELADRSGQHLLAQNVQAYDVWLRPSNFWAASWANPKSGSEDGGGVSDMARETALLDALSPWPQAVRVARYRLGQMDRWADGPKLLLWAQPKAVADAVMARLTAVGVSGVEVKARMARHYPQGALTAHAVGFTSLSEGNHGQEGLEMLLDRRLTYLRRDRQDPAPLRTTLDLETQSLADGALRAAMLAHGAKTGSVMVVDAVSGGVRAMVSAPGFDPNDAGTFRNPYQPDRMLNQTAARPVALGSLLTPLLVADLLQRGELKADAVVDLGAAQGLTVAGVWVRDVRPQAQATLAEIVARSSNVGQAKLALRLTEVQLQALLKGTGLDGDRAMSGLVTVDSVKPDWTAWTAGLHATAGQNLSSTMARVVQAYVPIANGGLQTRLSLVSDDAVLRTANPKNVPRVLSEQTACEVRRMLHQATGASGTAPLAMVAGVSVAGKTATNTHLPVWEEGQGMRYVPQADALFVGMFPAERPQYVIGVQLGFADTEPRFSGVVAAPVFAQVVRGMVAQGAVQKVSAQPSCVMPLETTKSDEALR